MGFILVFFSLVFAQQPQQISGVDVIRVAKPRKELQFAVTVPGALDDVWRAFSTTDGLKTWLWSDDRVDLRPGGDWLVLYPGGKTGGGTIVSLVPKKRITIRALAPEMFPTVRKERTIAVFEFGAVDASRTKVTLRQTGWKKGKEWDDAYEYLATGNAQLLAQLRLRFEKGPIDWSRVR
jgi:uncharacterized protein YndB with AHSA1/START domain